MRGYGRRDPRGARTGDSRQQRLSFLGRRRLIEIVPVASSTTISACSTVTLADLVCSMIMRPSELAKSRSFLGLH